MGKGGVSVLILFLVFLVGCSSVSKEPELDRLQRVSKEGEDVERDMREKMRDNCKTLRDGNCERFSE